MLDQRLREVPVALLRLFRHVVEVVARHLEQGEQGCAGEVTHRRLHVVHLLSLRDTDVLQLQDQSEEEMSPSSGLGWTGRL